MRIFTLRHQLEPPKPNYPQIIVCWKGRHEDISFTAVIMQSRQGLRGSEIQDLWYYMNYYIKSQKSWIIFNLFKTQEEKKMMKASDFFCSKEERVWSQKTCWMNKLFSASPLLILLFNHTRPEHGLMSRGTAQNQIPYPEYKVSYYSRFHSSATNKNSKGSINFNLNAI